MKHNRWLIYLVGILLVINLSVYFIFKYLKAENYFKNKIATILEGAFNAKVQLQEFNITEKQIFISNIKITSKRDDFSINAEQIYIDYNILSILLSQVFQAKMLEEIRIYNPVINYTYKYKKKNKLSKSNISNLDKLFKSVKIENAQVSLSVIKDKSSFNTQLDSLDLNIRQDKSIHINIESRKHSQTNVKIIGEYFNKNIKNLRCDIHNLKLNQLIIDQVATFDPLLNIYISYNKDKLLYDIQMPNDQLLLMNELTDYIEDPSIAYHNFRFYGNNQTAYYQVNLKNHSFDELKIKGKINHPLNQPELIGDLLINNLELPEISPYQGKIIVNTHYSFKDKLKLDALISCPQLTIRNNIKNAELYPQEINNVSLVLKSNDLLNKNIDFKTNSFNSFNGTSNISGQYSIKNQSLDMSFNAENINYEISNISLYTSLSGDLKLKNKELEITTTLNSLNAQYQDYYLGQLSGNIEYQDQKALLSIHNENESLEITLNHDVKNNQQQLLFKLKDFDLKDINQQFNLNPISLNAIAENSKDVFSFESKGEIHQKNPLDLHGKFATQFNINRAEKNSQLILNMTNAFLNNAPLSIQINAQGNLDSLETNRFMINQSIALKSKVRFTPQLSFAIDVLPQSIHLKDINKYIFDKNLQKQISGSMIIRELSFDNQQSESIKAHLEIQNFKHSQTKIMNISTKFKGSPDKIYLDQFLVQNDSTQFLNAKGEISQNFNKLQISGQVQANLEDILNIDEFKAKMLGQFEFSINNKIPTFKGNISIQDAFYQNYYADHFYINFEQKEKEFILHQFTMNANPVLSLNGQGSINYNFLNDQFYNSQNSILLNIKGNPLYYLSKEFELLDSAKSNMNGYLAVSMNEEGLLIKDGAINLENGKIKVKDQQEIIDKIKLSLSISNNKVKINDFQSRIGQGKLIIRNEILNNEQDFILGNVNFGQLFLKTEGEGILIHIPYYSPKNSVSNVHLKGRYTDEAQIYGPFDDIHIIGDVVFSNGSGIYPEDSENLQQYFNMWASAKKDQKKQNEMIEKKDIIEEDLPFTLDLKLRFNDNMRYQTYPLNLLVNPDSYLDLSYKNGHLGVNSAQFTSESGDIEIFGTVFKTDYLSVIITPYEYNPIVIGTFYKKVYDGSTIFLEVSSDRSNPNFLESLTFKLRSDNSEDKSTAQILAKLRYGKSLDELSQQQEELILQDEALQLVGVSLGSAFLDPYLSPVESKVRKWMKLDNFSLNPGFIQNLFNEYKSDNHSKFKTEEKDIASFSSSILLNNLSINMGKYINNKLYLGYDGLFQEENDLFRNNRLLMYNNLSLRYDLPYKFKLMYEYQIIPHNKKDAHEIRLMRSFKF